jgi:hypothetical protein
MVAADAQFTVARVLKPFEGFEDVYQGQDPFRPVAFPGGRDPRAGEDGFSPNLMRGHPVPLGSRILVWIPLAVTQREGTTAIQRYNYSFVWRLRNVRDFRQDRRPYHYPRQSPGAPNDAGPTPGPRFVIPACIDTVLYEQAEPIGPGVPAVQRAYQQTYTIGLGYELATFPILPGGASGEYQQGVLNPIDVGLVGAGGAIFTPLWLDAMGDELIIIATRTDQGSGKWDFTATGIDHAFSDVYGTGNGAHPSYPDIGIYVFSGSNP